jgi:chromosome segregation ATPase
MKREFLEGLGLEKSVIDQILDENSRDIGREKAKTDAAKEDADTLRGQLADRDKDIEALKALDADGLKQQLDELQTKYNTETKQYKTQLSDRDYADALNRAISAANIKFSSKAAEKAFIADLKTNRLELKDGDLQGFDAYHKAQLEADPTAFQDDKPAPVFSKAVGAGAPAAESKGAMYAKQFNAQYAPTKE